MTYLQTMKTVIMIICLSAATGCVMQNSIEASGGFFDGELQGNLPGANN